MYNADDQPVRVLDLGQASAGLHTKRNRDAYWGGTNYFSERVSISLHSYTIQTDDYHTVKGMVVLKSK